MFAIGGIYNLYTNIIGDFCIPVNGKTVETNLSDSENCIWNLPNALSLANKIKNQQAIGIQQWLNLITVVALTVYFQYFRYIQRTVANKLNENTVSPSDFTFVVSNVPIRSARTIKKDLEYFFKTHGLPDKRELNIRRIVLSYDVVRKLQALKMTILSEKNRINKIEAYMNKNEQTRRRMTLADRMVFLRQKIRGLDSALKHLTREHTKNVGRHSLVTVHETAFITVNTQQGSNRLLNDI